jgi:type II secretory pathway component PulC
VIEPRHKFRFGSALVVAGLMGIGLSLAYFGFVFFGSRPAKVETAEERAERCARAPSGELVVNGQELAPLADSTALAEAGKIKPVFTNGATVGLQIADIRAGSLYDRAGLCDRDIVTAVGGIRLDSPEATLDAYEQLRDQKLIAIELLRRGSAAMYRVRVE